MKILFILLCVFEIQTANAQYRYDNVAFKTIYWDELCKTLRQNPGHLLLDVRSKGEHDDTSMSKGLNIGHIQGAKNIDIREVGSRLKEIEAFKNKPVFVYCSHSQRSRRVSKMLADSGFVNVYNINGGVSNLRMFDVKDDCQLLKANLPYKILSPVALAEKKRIEYYILDVRPDSSFRNISTVERRNAFGRFDGSVNIPLAILEQKVSELPKDKEILIVDENGSESAAAGELLSKNGFKNLVVLFNGLDGYTMEVPEKSRTNWQKSTGYHLINSNSFNDMAKKSSVTIIDVRMPEEFSNTSKETFRNIGNLKEAFNIPFAEIDKQFSSLPADKLQNLVLYTFSSNPEVFEAAKKLAAQGYKNVYVLLGGLFNLRWRAANIKGQTHLKQWVVNVPADNQ